MAESYFVYALAVSEVPQVSLIHYSQDDNRCFMVNSEQ